MLEQVSYDIESLPGDLDSLLDEISTAERTDCIVIKKHSKAIAGIVSPDILRDLGIAGIPITIPLSAL